MVNACLRCFAFRTAHHTPLPRFRGRSYQISQAFYYWHLAVLRFLSQLRDNLFRSDLPAALDLRLLQTLQFRRSGLGKHASLMVLGVWLQHVSFLVLRRETPAGRVGRLRCAFNDYPSNFRFRLMSFTLPRLQLPKALESAWIVLRLQKLVPASLPGGGANWLSAIGLAILMDCWRHEREALSSLVCSALNPKRSYLI